jgi:hypothetical protein
MVRGMSGRHAFVDESKRGGYVVVAAVVVPGDLDATRRALRGLLLPEQSALHFKNERDDRRRQLLTGICDLPVEALVYVSDAKGQVEARRACLRAVVADLVGEGAAWLVLELSDGDLAADRRTLFAAVREHQGDGSGPDGPLRYDHLRAAADPLLWVPDAVAWAWAHGGVWRERVSSLVAGVTQV